MADRRDPMLTFAYTVLAANKEARLAGAHATMARVEVEPNATNAIPSLVRGWLDARAADTSTMDTLVEAVIKRATERAGRDGTEVVVTPESLSAEVDFDTVAGRRGSPALLGGAPILPTGAGHDAGVLSAQVPTAMLFVRNPTGISHSPAEHAEHADCAAGVEALATVLRTRWHDHLSRCVCLGRRPARSRCAHRGRPTACSPRSRPVLAAEGERLPGLVLPGFANAHSHAFHRALRGPHARRARQLLDLARADVRGRRAGSTRTATSRWPARSTPRWRWPASPRSASSTTCTTARTALPTPTRTPWVHALIAAAAEAGIRITLLDTLYLTSTVDGRPLEGVQRRFGDGDPERWATAGGRARCRAARQDRRGHPFRTRGARAPSRRGALGRGPLHVHLSEQLAENEQCQAVHGCTPTELLDRHGVLGPHTTAVHATHLTDHDVKTLGGTGTGVCFCPTTERDLADGIGPARDLADAGSPLSLGSDSHAVIDMFEEIRGAEMDERLATRQRGRFTHGRTGRAAAAPAAGTDAGASAGPRRRSRSLDSGTAGADLVSGRALRRRHVTRRPRRADPARTATCSRARHARPTCTPRDRRTARDRSSRDGRHAHDGPPCDAATRRHSCRPDAATHSTAGHACHVDPATADIGGGGDAE